jgi:phosphoribosylanthranilate isomerase
MASRPTTKPTTVQIVSHIDSDELARLAEIEPQIRQVQVIHVEGPDALTLIPVYSPFIHAFLLDSGRPNALEPELGGTRRRHDWTVSAAFVKASPLPVFLAGGLSADNAEDAIQRVRPYGLDLCSSIRTQDQLDPAKLTAFMQAVRSADQNSLTK